MREIARRAGVAEPTLRRRFRSRDELVAAAFQDKIAAYADGAEAALKNPDAWAGFTTFLRTIARLQLSDRGFAEVLTMSFPESPSEQERRRAYTKIKQLIKRAQEAGRLRPDFVAEDIVLVLLAHAGVVAASGPLAAQLSDRFLAYLVEAFAAPSEQTLPDAPSAARVYRALRRLPRPPS